MSPSPIRQDTEVKQKLLIGIGVAVAALTILRWFSSAELITVAPLVYTFWGVLIWLYTPTANVFWVFVVSAFILRLGCVGAGFVWSDDAYRYLWEGQAVLNGINPYTTPPAAFAVQDGVREYVNHPTISTVYPPLAQLWFAIQAFVWYNPIILQVTSALVDVGTAIAIWIWLIRQRLSVKNAWMYALHPLPIIECAWSAHLESLAVFCLAWGLVLHERWGKWVWFAGGWIKILPFVFLCFVRHWRLPSVLGMGALSILLVLPFWDPTSLNGLQTYVVHWSYNASIFGLLSFFVPSLARPMCMMIAAVSCGYVWWLWHQLHLSTHRAILCLGIIVVLCSPTVHPWYALWVMVPTLMVSDKTIDSVCLLWCSLIPLTYVSIFTLNPSTGEWSPPLWPTLVSYLVPLVLWIRLRSKKVPV